MLDQIFQDCRKIISIHMENILFLAFSLIWTVSICRIWLVQNEHSSMRPTYILKYAIWVFFSTREKLSIRKEIAIYGNYLEGKVLWRKMICVLSLRTVEENSISLSDLARDVARSMWRSAMLSVSNSHILHTSSVEHLRRVSFSCYLPARKRGIVFVPDISGIVI